MKCIINHLIKGLSFSFCILFCGSKGFDPFFLKSQCMALFTSLTMKMVILNSNSFISHYIDLAIASSKTVPLSLLCLQKFPSIPNIFCTSRLYLSCLEIVSETFHFGMTTQDNTQEHSVMENVEAFCPCCALCFCQNPVIWCSGNRHCCGVERFPYEV